MQAYHCDYIPKVDLLVVVLVAARSSDFDQPHPHNRPHTHHPPGYQQQQEQEPKKHQQQVQQHHKFGHPQEEHAALVHTDSEGGVLAVVVEVRWVQPVVVG